MAKYATKEELIEIAKAYCNKMGYTFIFANENKFGFEDKNGNLWTLDYFELAEKLGASSKNEVTKVSKEE